jgi:hypothetical protein
MGHPDKMLKISTLSALPKFSTLADSKGLISFVFSFQESID